MRELGQIVENLSSKDTPRFSLCYSGDYLVRGAIILPCTVSSSFLSLITVALGEVRFLRLGTTSIASTASKRASTTSSF